MLAGYFYLHGLAGDAVRHEDNLLFVAAQRDAIVAHIGEGEGEPLAGRDKLYLVMSCTTRHGRSFLRALRTSIPSQARPTQNVEMAVLLRLEGVLPKVREEAGIRRGSAVCLSPRLHAPLLPYPARALPGSCGF